jgi:hypothetical protein
MKCIFFQIGLTQILIEEKTALFGALHILLVFKYSEKYVNEIIAVPQFCRKLPRKTLLHCLAQYVCFSSRGVCYFVQKQDIKGIKPRQTHQLIA